MLVAVGLLGACGVPAGTPCEGNGDCELTETCVDGECRVVTGADSGSVGTDAGRIRALSSISIEPGDVVLTSTDGSMPEQDFNVLGHYDDGSTGAVMGPRFELDSPRLGRVDSASGLFVADSLIGGQATLTASLTDPAGGSDLTATATIRVVLEATILGEGVPDDIASRFAGDGLVDDARRANLVYPLDHAVMPQNVYPADMQWLLGAAGDFYRIVLMKTDMSVTVYLAKDTTPRDHWLVNDIVWRALAQTHPEEEATLTLDRWEASSSEHIAGTPVHLRFASAALTGTVYYWSIAEGRIVRINDGTATREDFMPRPPAPQDVTAGRCVGCHTVSNSGRYMVGRLGGGYNIAGVFDLTTDLTVDPPATEFPLVRSGGAMSPRWWFSTWSPDDLRLAATTEGDGSSGSNLSIFDPFTGEALATTGTRPGAMTQPSWSPDGTEIAYVSGTTNWGGNNIDGDLSIVPISADNAFGEIRSLHTAASLDGTVAGISTHADAYPTWTPDSAQIAFSYGSGSRSDDAFASLFITDRAGTNVTRLGTACGGADTRDNFQPNFSPFTEGGYYWMTFLSNRAYGNAHTGIGTRGVVAPERRQQIWVSAIRVGAAPDEGPSEVGYWLPGQSPENQNISAYWAPRACREDGEACSVGSECCGGDCRPGAEGALVCSPPPPERCRMRSETCSTDADCCDSLSCLGNVCIEAPQ